MDFLSFQIKAFNYLIMLEFVKNMLADERGSISHKRLLGTIASFIMFGAFIWSEDIELKKYLGNFIFWLICLWGGLATVDKMTNK